MENDTNDIVDTGAPQAGAAAPEAVAPMHASVDELDQLLKDFDDHTASLSAAKPTAEPAAAETDAAPVNVPPAIDPVVADHVGRLEHTVASMRAAERVRADRADFQNVTSIAEGRMREAGLVTPDGFAEQWLLREVLTNPELTAAWEKRNDTHRDRDRAERLVEKAMRKMHQAARTMPDPVATGDRMMVAAAMRGSSSGRSHQSPAPNYATMSDTELNAEKDRMYER